MREALRFLQSDLELEPIYFPDKEYVMTAYRSDLFFGSLTGNGRVLVVDDEPDVRRVVRLMLEKAGTRSWKQKTGRQPSR